jgi:hypothetical protein|tara:strand:- start:437 stop:1339 length:903 start_codon:yes stop_codon:yes gene_type:complete
MQEIKTNKSEELVPIDTSGDAVDVEVKEEQSSTTETTSDGPIVEVTGQETATETKPEELEEYSAGVKKRIDKLTRKMREAERREQAAIEYAKKIQNQQKVLQSQLNQKDALFVEEGTKKLDAQEEFAKRALQAAIQEGDTEKQVEAQQAMAKMAIERERLTAEKIQLEAQKAQPQTQQQEYVEQPVQPRASGKAKEWADRNDWFNSDRAMTFTSMEIHKDLVQEGFDVESDEYYNEIDARIRKEFPQKFGDQPKVTQKVASAVRTSSPGRRTVRLTPSQVAIAKKLGVPLEEYAKHVKEA